MNDEFTIAADVVSERDRFMVAFGELHETIELLELKAATLDEVEPEVRAAFIKFMVDMNYKLMLKNFEALLKEKSGPKFLRNDGSVNWLHEFIPDFIFMKLAYIGKEKGGFDFEALELFGGMEASLGGHLRHDSGEDFTTQEGLVLELQEMINEISSKQHDPENVVNELDVQARQILINCHFMTQKMQKLLPPDDLSGGIRFYEELHDGELIAVDEMSKIYHRPDGDYAKQDVVIYMGEMVYNPESTPIIFLFKQLDSCHNLPTMLSPKFTPDRRLKRANEREDMYGSRNGLPEAAAARWPEFAEAIKTIDAHLGFFIYSHFGILQNVDRFYKNPYVWPNGFTKYLPDMFRLELPRLVDVRQMMMDNQIKFGAQSPIRAEMMTKYIERRVLPALGDYKDRFTQLRDYESKPYYVQHQTLSYEDTQELGFEPKPVAFE